MNIKNNKKSKESIKKIQNSLYKLLSSLGDNKLTIKELCQDAKINRTTFYAHFDSIEDALYQICEEYIVKIYKVFLNTNVDYKTRVGQALEIIKSKFEFFVYIFLNVNNLELRVIEMIENSCLDEISDNEFEKSRLSLVFIISGFIGIGKTYFNDLEKNKTIKISKDEFCELICNVINKNNPYFIIE